MGFTRNYLVSLFLYISIVNEIRQPAVTCQDEEGMQCIPKKTFMAMLRIPEVRSNLAAYLRTALMVQEVKNHDDMVHLKALSSEENEDFEICIPGGTYLELFRNPVLRSHLSAMERSYKFPGRFLSEEVDSRDLIPESEKRSLATLAKNGDLPITIQERESDNDDEEKRSASSSDNVGSLHELFDEVSYRRRTPEIYDYLTEQDPEVLEYSPDKRNVGSLARDFALPTGRRHIASVARDHGLPSGKRNVGSLARQSMLPLSGKRNVASLARYYMLPQSGKRNVAALARDSSLPYGKRYLGSLARSGSYPTRDYDEGKRSIASLARSGDWPSVAKRGRMTSGRIMARVLNRRYGRSLSDDREAPSEPLDLQQLIRQGNSEGKENEWQATPFTVSEDLDEGKAKNRSNRRIEASQTRHKRQIDFSDEYPLPVMQNNMLDYEDMMEAIADHYPNAEKRFMGSESEMPADSGYPEVLQPSKRHIGSLARLGWLPSFRAPRFSRSPRYLVDRENPADGSSSNYTPDASTRSLRPIFTPKTRYLQSLHGDCRHGFKRFLLLPDMDNFLRTSNSHIAPRSM
ncbi:neuropeptide-like 1 isoform X1 [Camponotus floridanus]|uniref:neuropeptide-like 1 isoform X1 n=1 Tax=Camponotus floridanus TaxID=104421 RepID=UPI000DC6A482|nr:neuropeptide-like 1 isoform X1 [Camponotus floridanus]